MWKKYIYVGRHRIKVCDKFEGFKCRCCCAINSQTSYQFLSVWNKPLLRRCCGAWNAHHKRFCLQNKATQTNTGRRTAAWNEPILWHICEKFYSNVCFTSFGQTLCYHKFQRPSAIPVCGTCFFAIKLSTQSPSLSLDATWMTTTLLRSALMNNTTHPVWILIDLIPYNPNTAPPPVFIPIRLPEY